jgi:N-acetylmuramoyl-L-alanine amidase
MRVALDAGHGEKHRLSSGASGYGLIEDTLALDFVTRIGHHLRVAGHATVLTRPDPRSVELKQRGKAARQAHCDLFLSIHLNASLTCEAHGCEALVVEGDEASKRIAEPLLAVLVANGMHSRGVKCDNQGQHKSLRVLRDTYRSMPAVLLEMGFLTNAGDVERLANKFWREKVSSQIAATLA